MESKFYICIFEANPSLKFRTLHVKWKWQIKLIMRIRNGSVCSYQQKTIWNNYNRYSWVRLAARQATPAQLFNFILILHAWSPNSFALKAKCAQIYILNRSRRTETRNGNEKFKQHEMGKTMSRKRTNQSEMHVHDYEILSLSMI